MSVPFESESINEERSTDINSIMHKIGLTEKEKYTLKLIMNGMNPYKVSKHLGMSNHGIYNRVYRARDKYVKVYGVPASCNLQF
jgi:DNA-binding CsgD family transcriptional regulator